MKNNRFKQIIPMLFLLLLLVGCGKETAGTQINLPTPEPQSTVSLQESIPETTEEISSVESEESIEPEPVFEEYDINLMALGDNLMHMGIVYTGRMEDKSYNYDFLFQNMTDFLQYADLKAINQETILGGNNRGFSGFPYFNSPTEVGDAIAAAGFNIVTHATNHAADQQIDGLLYCANFWSQYPDITMVGISEEENPPIHYLTVKDHTFAILNYTYGPNVETIPKSIIGHLNILCNFNPDTGRLDFTNINPKVLEDIAEAKENADFVIVFPHWGTEYASTPSKYQQKFALQMTEAGADIIIGTHPHVPQPVEWITAENGNTSLCYYSLGNYVSTQKTALSMLEEMAWVSFHVTEEGIAINPEKSGVIPLVCHYRSNPVRLENVYLLEEYTEEMAARHGIRGYGGINLHLETLQNYCDEIIGDFALKKADVLPNISPDETNQ